MEVSLAPLSQLDPDGLFRLAKLHCEVMHTLLAELGLPLVLRYYQAAQGDPSVLGLCALGADGAITGWAMGSSDPAALNSRLRWPLPWFAGQILRLAFTRPTTLFELLGSTLSAPAANTILAGQIELTYIGVATSSQGQGLGTIILAAFMERARAAGYRSVVLSVETDHPAAIALYKRAGFSIWQTYREGRFERHRMTCQLPQD
jgi:ribosomal protein S18 acetylase RimI-like enzyme